MNRWSAQTTERPCQSRPSVERRERAANRWPSHEHAIIWSGGMAALGAISDRTVLRTGCFWALATVHKFPGWCGDGPDDEGRRRRRATARSTLCPECANGDRWTDRRRRFCRRHSSGSGAGGCRACETASRTQGMDVETLRSERCRGNIEIQELGKERPRIRIGGEMRVGSLRVR